MNRVSITRSFINYALLTSFLPLMGSCIDVQLPEVTLLGDGPIVLRGVMAADADSACPLWISDSGLEFILFQDSRLSNTSFDEVIVAGTTSRLELRGRSDLGAACAPGAQNVEVVAILEIDGEDFAQRRLTELRKSVDDLLQETRDQLSQKRAETIEDLRALVDQIEHNLEQRKNELQETADEIFESLRDNLDDREGIKDQFDQFVNNIKQKIDDVADELEDAKDGFVDDLGDRIDEFLENLRTVVENWNFELEDRLQELVPDLDGLTEQLQDAVDALRMELEDHLDDKREEVRQSLEDLRDQFKSDFEMWLAELRDQLVPSLPDPDIGIPPILGGQSSKFDLITLAVHSGTVSFESDVRVGLRDVIDQIRTEVESTIGDVFAGILADGNNTGND